LDDGLPQALFDAGILQFGLFGDGVQRVTRLELLPSYPVLMQRCAKQMAQMLAPEMNRVVCMSENAALGAVVSVESGLPLIIGERVGDGHITFLGAYDIEHPSAFVGMQSATFDSAARLDIQQRAERVGLQIVQWLWILDDIQDDDGNGAALMTLGDAVAHLVERQVLPFRPV
jgi:hypothetical protein